MERTRARIQSSGRSVLQLSPTLVTGPFGRDQVPGRYLVEIVYSLLLVNLTST